MKKITFLLTFLSLFLLSNKINAQDLDFFEPTTTIGGYGELHYNSVIPEVGDSKNTLDFHRFVLFFGHSFSEKWSFKSELELEHNFVKDGQGELELEQAYVDYHHADWFGFQAGVILPSAGLINEYHEPPLFLSVERPDYNKVIIPTTWFGNGAALYGNYSGLDYKLTVMEGFDADGFSAGSALRGGRMKGYKADAENLLYNLRVDYLDIPGLKVGASYTYNNSKGDSLNNRIGLAEFHALYVDHNIYAAFEFGNISFEEGEVETARGFYADLGYNIGSLMGIKTEIIPFIRYSDINTAAQTKSGGSLEQQYHFTKMMFGISVMPLPQIVFKADYSISERELGGVKTNYFNIGAGYMF